MFVGFFFLPSSGVDLVKNGDFVSWPAQLRVSQLLSAKANQSFVT